MTDNGDAIPKNWSSWTLAVHCVRELSALSGLLTLTCLWREEVGAAAEPWPGDRYLDKSSLKQEERDV